MKKVIIRVIIAAIIILIALLLFAKTRLNINYSPETNELNFLKLEENWNVEVFADDLGGSRVSIPGPNNGVRMLEYKDGIVYATLPGKSEVIAISYDKNWKEYKRTVFISRLLRPHGITLYQDWIYIAAENEVVRVKDLDKDGVADDETFEKLVDLPVGTHWTRSIKIFNDKMYISIGSTCNVCNEEDPLRAKVLECDLNGNNCSVFASGLRNSVDLTYFDNRIWATDNGRDLAGKDIPPDEINVLEKGNNYGWPICYDDKVHDTDFDKKVYIRDPCIDTISPVFKIQAHSAPLGLEFLNDDELLVALHGSWDRSPPTGYKIIKINILTGKTTDFISGFLGDNTIYGRPVDILKIDENNILISDDVAGKIYRVYKK